MNNLYHIISVQTAAARRLNAIRRRIRYADQHNLLRGYRLWLQEEKTQALQEFLAASEELLRLQNAHYKGSNYAA